MRALFYILRRSLVNIIKGLSKKPAALIAYLVIGAFFISMSILSGINSETNRRLLDLDTAKAIFVGYILFFVVITLMASLTSGSSFFRLADVNLLFTAPIKAGNILVYGFIKQLGVNLMVSLFLMLQYPNWKRMFGFTEGAGFVLFLTYVLMVMLSSMLGMALYSFTSKNNERRNWVTRGFYAAGIVFILPIILETLKTGDLIKSVVGYLANDRIQYVPVIGWFREVLLSTITGITPSFYINTFLILAVSGALFIYLYSMGTDYFEDVLSNTEKKEQIVKAAREGKTGAAYMMNSRRKYRKVKFHFTLEGSGAIFQKQILELRKSGIWFISSKTFVLLAGALIAVFTAKVEGSLLIAIFLAVSVYIMMIFSMVGAWSGELSKHYIYLIPASPVSKLFYATLPQVIKVLVEGMVIFGITGVLVECPIVVILSAVAAYTMMGAVFTYSDLFIRRVFGMIHGNVLRLFFRMFLVMFVLIPVIAVTVLIISFTQNYALAFMTGSLINLLVVALFILAGYGLFDNPEFE